MATWTMVMTTTVAMASAIIELLISKPPIEKRLTGIGVMVVSSANSGGKKESSYGKKSRGCHHCGKAILGKHKMGEYFRLSRSKSNL